MAKKNKHIEINDEYTISMRKFVNVYLEKDGNFSKLRHKELVAIDSPFVISLTPKTVDKNLELLFDGHILAVRDCTSKIKFYANPSKLREACNYEYWLNKLAETRHKPIKELEKLASILPILEKMEEADIIIDVLREDKKYGKLLYLRDCLFWEGELERCGVLEPSVSQPNVKRLKRVDNYRFD